MAVVRIAELDIDPSALHAYTALLAKEIEASVRIEPGVLFLYAVSMSDAPNSLRIVEGYTDEAAYEAHLQTAHFLDYKAATATMIRGLRLLAVTPVAMHGKGAIHLP